MSRHSSKWAKPRSSRRVAPRSSQTVVREQIREEAPVMADEHKRGAARIEIALQPFDGREVEMVGRLVEQQNVGRRRQRARERCAARFAAREMRRVFLAGRGPSSSSKLARDVRVVGRLQAGFDIGERRGVAGKVRLLRQVAHQRARLHEDACRCRARPGRRRSSDSVDLPEPLRPTSDTRSPVETERSAPDNKGVPPKVSAMPVNCKRGGGAIFWGLSLFLPLVRRYVGSDSRPAPIASRREVQGERPAVKD